MSDKKSKEQQETPYHRYTTLPQEYYQENGDENVTDNLRDAYFRQKFGVFDHGDVFHLENATEQDRAPSFVEDYDMKNSAGLFSAQNSAFYDENKEQKSLSSTNGNQFYKDIGEKNTYNEEMASNGKVNQQQSVNSFEDKNNAKNGKIAGQSNSKASEISLQTNNFYVKNGSKSDENNQQSSPKEEKMVQQSANYNDEITNKTGNYDINNGNLFENDSKAAKNIHHQSNHYSDSKKTNLQYNDKNKANGQYYENSNDKSKLNAQYYDDINDKSKMNTHYNDKGKMNSQYYEDSNNKNKINMQYFDDAVEKNKMYQRANNNFNSEIDKEKLLYHQNNAFYDEMNEVKGKKVPPFQNNVYYDGRYYNNKQTRNLVPSQQHLEDQEDAKNRQMYHSLNKANYFTDEMQETKKMYNTSGFYDEDDDSSDNKKVKKTGRKKISMEYIEVKNKRSVTFSKRKKGIMKKAYELNVLTGTQILLLVASESGHVYTFATPKLKPIIQNHERLIQSCLNAPSSPQRNFSKEKDRDDKMFVNYGNYYHKQYDNDQDN